jgi:hypothetical protein
MTADLANHIATSTWERIKADLNLLGALYSLNKPPYPDEYHTFSRIVYDFVKEMEEDDLYYPRLFNED